MLIKMNIIWDEPPSKEEIFDEIDKCWFIRNLRLTSNPYHNKYCANKILRQKYVDLYNKNNKVTQKNFNFDPNGKYVFLIPKHITITFETINFYPSSKSILSKIIDEEITKELQVEFGSYREFKTLFLPKLEQRIINRAIREIWCVIIIKKYMKNLTKKFIENRFAPGGNGYLEAKERFENNNYHYLHL